MAVAAACGGKLSAAVDSGSGDSGVIAEPESDASVVIEQDASALPPPLQDGGASNPPPPQTVYGALGGYAGLRALVADAVESQICARWLREAIFV